MRNNLFTGIAGTEGDTNADNRNTLLELFNDIQLDGGSITISRCHRIGPIPDI